MICAVGVDMPKGQRFGLSLPTRISIASPKVSSLRDDKHYSVFLSTNILSLTGQVYCVVTNRLTTEENNPFRNRINVLSDILTIENNLIGRKTFVL